jgi:hypothetical protein
VEEKYPKSFFFLNGLIIPSDLADDRKIQGFFKSDLIVMGYLPRWKNTRNFQNDLIIMGYLPNKKIRGFFEIVSL